MEARPRLWADPPLGCGRCFRLPDAGPEPVAAYLWPGSPRARGLMLRALRAVGADAAWEAELGAIRIGGGELAVNRALEALEDTLARPERRAARVLVLPEDRAPHGADIARAVSLRQLLGMRRAEHLLRVLASGTLDCHFQPIVAAADGSRRLGHEALLRASGAGGTLAPGRLFASASEADLLLQLDMAARAVAARRAAQAGLDGLLFLNFCPASVLEPGFCPACTVAVLERTGLDPARVVLEVVESGRIADLEHLRAVLDGFHRRGVSVALDDLGAGFASLDLLVALRPDFVKLDRELTRGVARDRFRAAVAHKLVELAAEVGIPVIAEGVEDAADLRWLCEAGVAYVQGNLIAPPAPAAA